MSKHRLLRDVSSAAAIGVVLAVVVSLVVTLLLSPPETPTEPAPLPPGTGVDGSGTDGPPVVLQPDAGPNVVVKPGPDGTGGEVFGRTLALYHGQQDVRVNAGKWYPSGGAHFAIDWGVWRGTPVYAPRDALVVGRNNGVPNDLGGSDSNWVLLCRNVNGKPALLYLQHLSPGFIHKRGPVAAGELVGYSGNSGHSSGDHLHEAAGWSPTRCGGIDQARASWLRYLYLNDTATSIFEPMLWEAQPRLPRVALSVQIRVAKTHGRSPGTRHIRRALGLPDSTWFNPRTNAAYARRFPATRGIPTCRTLRILGKDRFTVRC